MRKPAIGDGVLWQLHASERRSLKRSLEPATAKGRPDIALSGQYSILPWNIANIGRWNNGSNVTPVFNYTYTSVSSMKITKRL